MSSYRFYHNARIVEIKAEGIVEAKLIFQERFGYWPTSSQVVSNDV